MGQPVADAIGVARRPVERMLGRRSSPRTSAPPTTRPRDAAGRRRPARRRRRRRTDRRPASGPGARRWGRRPRTTTTSVGRPASASRERRTVGPQRSAHGVDDARPAGWCRRSAGRRRRPARGTTRSPRTGSCSACRPAPPVTRRDASGVSSVRKARTSPAATSPPPSIPCRPSQEPERRAGRDGAMGCTTSQRAPRWRRSPMTIPGHRPAAVGPPPTGPHRTVHAWWRHAPPVRGSLRRDGVLAPGPPYHCPALLRGTSSTRIRGTTRVWRLSLARQGTSQGSAGARSWLGRARGGLVLLVLLAVPMAAASDQDASCRAPPSRRGAARPATTIVVTVVYQNANGSRAEHVSRRRSAAPSRDEPHARRIVGQGRHVPLVGQAARRAPRRRSSRPSPRTTARSRSAAGHGHDRARRAKATPKPTPTPRADARSRRRSRPPRRPRPRTPPAARHADPDPVPTAAPTPPTAVGAPTASRRRRPRRRATPVPFVPWSPSPSARPSEPTRRPRCIVGGAAEPAGPGAGGGGWLRRPRAGGPAAVRRARDPGSGAVRWPASSRSVGLQPPRLPRHARSPRPW